jgi:menaquinol-cytochrome c reductase iron-sulfur subunit
MSTTNAVHPGGSEGQTRRGFHLVLLNLLGALVTAAIALPTLVYLLFPPKSHGDAGWIDAGDIGSLTPGTPVEMSFQKTSLDAWRLVTEKKTAWVVKSPDGKITAFGPQCTHLGCAYHWDNDKFLCPCHTSYFSVEGKVISGPAPRPLDQYVTKIDGTRLQVGALKQNA